MFGSAWNCLSLPSTVRCENWELTNLSSHWNCWSISQIWQPHGNSLKHWNWVNFKLETYSESILNLFNHLIAQHFPEWSHLHMSRAPEMILLQSSMPFLNSGLTQHFGNSSMAPECSIGFFKIFYVFLRDSLWFQVLERIALWSKSKYDGIRAKQCLCRFLKVKGQRHPLLLMLTHLGDNAG